MFMNHSLRWLRLAAFGLLLLGAAACVEEAPEAVAPRADLIFTVVDEQNVPVEGAKVFLFGTEAAYDAYRAQDNPNGDPAIEPDLPLENGATTNALGEARFLDRRLEGTSSAVGETFVYQPRPLYYRVLAEQNGRFLTNDSNDRSRYRLAFPELASGEVILETVEVILR